MSRCLPLLSPISARKLCHYASALAITAALPIGCRGSVESSDIIDGTGGTAGKGGVDSDGAAGGGAGGTSAGGWAGAAGVGGAAGSGYAGSAGGPDIPCMPGSISSCSCSSSTAGTHTCTPDGAGYGVCVCTQTETDVLVWYRTQIVGSWSGTGTNPWQDPYEVVFEFRADGTYFASCVQTTNCLALYYGQDVDSPLRTYVLDDIKANHLAQGQIAQVFGNQVGYDAMLDVAIDENAQQLWFSVMDQGIYGPIKLDLHRTGP
jgi:hypothetical protein